MKCTVLLAALALVVLVVTGEAALPLYYPNRAILITGDPGLKAEVCFAFAHVYKGTGFDVKHAKGWYCVKGGTNKTISTDVYEGGELWVTSGGANIKVNSLGKVEASKMMLCVDWVKPFDNQDAGASSCPSGQKKYAFYILAPGINQLYVSG